MDLYNMCRLQQLQASARARTFWTICPTCRTKYQYYHSILKKAVCCPYCLKPFVANVLTEQPVPSGPNPQSDGMWKNAGVFSEIRLLQKFETGQVWALYSEKDKFPNNYVFIEKVDLRHNELQARWLEICHEGEVEKRSVKEDQTIGCGTFRISSSRSAMTYTDTKPFSHPVPAIFTGRRNSYEIYPRKGEVWALLKGWEIDWSSAADFNKNYKYEVVQVLSDFTTGTSITVVPLVKIKVFVSLFMQSKEASPYLIPPDDTIWFSHCIPYHLMNASESEGIQEGALELDPAALPLNLEEALACVLPESSSVKGQEFDANYAGTITGNDSRNGSLGVGEQHVTCVNPEIFTEREVEENRHQNTPPSPDGTDVDQESNDFIQAEVECPSNRRKQAFNSVSNNGLDPNAEYASHGDTIICADSEFFDFDQLRDEKQFRANQIWAVYDSQGCMPRFYARITKVNMTPEFMVHYVWLDFDPTNKAEVAWSHGHLPVACGHFKIGSSGRAKETNMFCQIISCVKSQIRISYEIYPRKGKTWALFKGWDLGWSSDAHKHTDCEYEVVQVVSDLITSTSIIVMPLVKIKGFTSLFIQSKEATPYVIPQDNILRFSHCVPHHLMCGTEREGIPEGALELDPAALPLNLDEAFASVVLENSSVKGQEFDTKYAGSSRGNNSCQGSMRVGERQQATCFNAGSSSGNNSRKGSMRVGQRQQATFLKAGSLQRRKRRRKESTTLKSVAEGPHVQGRRQAPANEVMQQSDAARILLHLHAKVVSELP